MADQMSEIRAAIANSLRKLGYTVNVFKFIRINFKLDDDNAGGFDVESVNARKLEITIMGKVKEFAKDQNVFPSLDKIKGQGYILKRFNKDVNAVDEILKWVSTAVVANTHLCELLHPEAPLPEPYVFAQGTFVADDYYNKHTVFHGIATEATAQDIITTSGRAVLHTAFNPNAKPFFLVEVKVRHSSKRQFPHDLYMITDGDVWYPVRMDNDGNKQRHTVFIDNSVVAGLSLLNQNDKQLIHMAIRHYVDDLLKEKKDE